MTIKIGINGFGRIGRLVLRACKEKEAGLKVVAVNDLTSPATLAHLLRYDSIHGTMEARIKAGEQSMQVDDDTIAVTSFMDPSQIPWSDFGVDIVIEATGQFCHREGAAKHLQAGARKVIITAPGKDADATLVMGVNHTLYEPERHHVISNASCTTNCLAPLVKVLHQQFNIEYGLMTTIHSYTNDQRILDLPHRDLRRARAAAQSMIPTTTGAARAMGLVMPELAGKLNGFSVRVPTPNVSLVDLAIQVTRDTTAEEVNQALHRAAQGDLLGILGYTEEPLVSRDFYGDSRSSIVDALSTMVMAGKMVKVLSWYDNEWGYSCRVLDLARHVAGYMD